MTNKSNFPLGILADFDDEELTSFFVIRSAVHRGWQDVDFDSVENYIHSSLGSGTLTNYIFDKRDEALDWLNSNCVEDNVRFTFGTTTEWISDDESVELFTFALVSKEYAGE